TINHLPLTINHFFLIRPEAARLVENETEAVNVVNGRLAQHSFRGRYQLISLTTSHQPPFTLKFELETAVSLPPIGHTIQLSIDPEGIVPLESG
ncbi:MAG: TOBE domain-containing protein, partial [Candidatus Promineifilaceae bacterium]